MKLMDKTINKSSRSFYGPLFLVCFFFMIRQLTSNEELAFFSSLILSLMGLHVTQSHIAITDVEVTFWLYALMYGALLYLREKRIGYFIFAVISCGLALSLKMAF